MTGFNHTLAGATIALALREPLLIAPIAVASHFVMDAMPHFDKHPKLVPYNTAFKRYLFCDAMLCTTFLLWAIWLTPDSWFILAWGAAWATLPDFLWLLRNRSPRWADTFFAFHENIQWAGIPQGWWYEVVYMVGLIYAILQLL